MVAVWSSLEGFVVTQKKDLLMSLVWGIIQNHNRPYDGLIFLNRTKQCDMTKLHEC